MRGFTLIELMIVLAIGGILASIAIPPVVRYFGGDVGSTYSSSESKEYK